MFHVFKFLDTDVAAASVLQELLGGQRVWNTNVCFFACAGIIYWGLFFIEKMF